jgi:hypothetical protein
MSQERTKEAIQHFSIAERAATNPSAIVTSGVIPPKLILDVAFSAKSATQFNSGGFTNLATSIGHIEAKLDLIMKKLGIPNTMP